MRRPRARILAALMLVIGVSLVGSTSYARYLETIGPRECCRSHCHRGKSTAADDAARCCTVHLSVLPAALGAGAPDLHHVFTALGAAAPLALLAPTPVDAEPVALLRATLRGSPPTTLVALHSTLLI